MAAITAAAFLENGGLSYTADILRRVTKAMRETQGVASAGDMAVSQNGTPNMSVNVAAGQACVDGTQTPATQGSYVGTNDAVVNLAIAASDPTNPRIDIVVAQFDDSVYSGATNDFKLAVVTGTPAVTPNPPATPANAMVLAQVRVNATVTSVVNGNITDQRTFLQQSVFPGSSGVTFWDSTGALKNLTIPDSGLIAMRNAVQIPPSQNGTVAPSSYGSVPVKLAETSLGGAAATVVFTSIPSGFRHLVQEWYARGDTAAASTSLLVRFNAISTATYDQQAGTFRGASALSSESLGQTAMIGGQMPANTATANYFGQGRIEVKNYLGTIGNKLINAQDSYGTGDTTGLLNSDNYAGKWRTTATAVTELDVIAAAGNFVANSLFTFWGTP